MSSRPILLPVGHYGLDDDGDSDDGDIVGALPMSVASLPARFPTGPISPPIHQIMGHPVNLQEDSIDPTIIKLDVAAMDRGWKRWTTAIAERMRPKSA